MAWGSSKSAGPRGQLVYSEVMPHSHRYIAFWMLRAPPGTECQALPPAWQRQASICIFSSLLRRPAKCHLLGLLPPEGSLWLSEPHTANQVFSTVFCASRTHIQSTAQRLSG